MAGPEGRGTRKGGITVMTEKPVEVGAKVEPGQLGQGYDALGSTCPSTQQEAIKRVPFH